MFLFIRVILSFALVGVLLWCFARAGSGRLGAILGGGGGGAGGATDQSLELVARRQLSKNVGVVLVRSGTRHLLLGTGDNGIQVLAEGDDLIVEAPEPEPPSPTKSSALALLAGGDDVEVIQDEPMSQTPRRMSRATARTRPANPQGSNPARMNLFEAIRELTVRRS